MPDTQSRRRNTALCKTTDNGIPCRSEAKWLVSGKCVTTHQTCDLHKAGWLARRTEDNPIEITLLVEYDRQAYDTILRWTMPRFEDLMDRQGRIRLRTRRPLPPDTTQADAILQWDCVRVGAVDRGWRLETFRWEQEPDWWWSLTLTFEPCPIERQYALVLNGQGHVRLIAEADFDAMLAALEPYELVADEPVVVDTSRAPA